MLPQLTPNAQALILLTQPLRMSKTPPAQSQPLTLAEYNALAAALHRRGQEPKGLLSPQTGPALIQELLAAGAAPANLPELLGRGFLLSQALEYWQARGINAVSRADPDYPAAVKTALKSQAPPILYYCGAPARLNPPGPEKPYVANGDRSGDPQALLHALHAGRQAYAVFCGNLEQAPLHRPYHRFLQEDQLLLLSANDPRHPGAPATAQERDRLILALS